MLVLFTDYGGLDPYVGQVKAVVMAQAPNLPVIDLLHEVPAFNAHAGAVLLAALAPRFPAGSVFLAVVDPGVGGPRQPVVMEADGRWYVGPDNGLLSIVAGRAQQARYWRIDWQPDALSASFHGRDLFAPIAAELAVRGLPETKLRPLGALQVQFDASDLARIVYIDHYGNAWTGLRDGPLHETAGAVGVKEQTIAHCRVFADAAKGELFWYVNSVGLIEIAANRASAAALLDLKIGDPVRLSGSPDSRLH